MKTIFSVLILGLLMALCCSAQTPPPDQIQTMPIDCVATCNALGLSGWSWTQCFITCTAANYLLMGSLPPSLKENPFFIRPCPQKQIVPKPDLQIAARLMLRAVA